MRRAMKYIAILPAVASMLSATIVCATESDNSRFYPGRDGGATMGDTYYEVVRIGTSLAWGRRGFTTMPNWNIGRYEYIYGTWTDVAPAAAATGSRLWIAHRDSNGKPMVMYTDNIGSTDSPSWQGFEEFNESMYSAPGIAVLGSRLYVFWVPYSGGPVYYRYLPTNQTTGWSSTYTLGGGCTSAPHAVVVGNGIVIFVRGSGGNMYYNSINSSGGASTWKIWTPRSFSQPADWKDWSYATQWGGHINIEEPCTNWSSYHSGETSHMQAKTVKFVMDYDINWINGARSYEYACRMDEVDSAIAAGATVICFRTADTRVDGNYIKRFMGDPDNFGEYMHFKGNNVTLKQYITNKASTNPSVLFIIECGNEFNTNDGYFDSITPNAYRTGLAWAGSVISSTYRTSALSRVSWCANLAVMNPHVPHGGFYDMKDMFLSSSWGYIQDWYDCLSVHAYGANDLTRHDPEQPMTALFYAMSKLRSGKWIFISEIGINNTNSWTWKGYETINFIKSLPGECMHVSFFTQSLYADWNNGVKGRYVLECPYNNGNTTCNGLPYFTNWDTGRPFASVLRGF